MSIRDFDPASKTLRILGKGRGTQAETIDLGSATVPDKALSDYGGTGRDFPQRAESTKVEPSSEA
ncbi:MAG: hypothetical protein WCF82_23475 [Microcoleus sp.]